MHGTAEIHKGKQAIAGAVEGAEQRKLTVVSILRRELVARGHQVSGETPEGRYQVDGRNAFMFTLDQPRQHEDLWTVRMRIRILRPIIHVDMDHVSLEPPRGFADGKLRQMAEQIHNGIQALKRQDEQRGQRLTGQQRIMEAATRINKTLGITAGEPGFVFEGGLQLRVTQLGRLSVEEAELLASFTRDLAHLRSEQGRG